MGGYRTFSEASLGQLCLRWLERAHSTCAGSALCLVTWQEAPHSRHPQDYPNLLVEVEGWEDLKQAWGVAVDAASTLERVKPPSVLTPGGRPLAPNWVSVWQVLTPKESALSAKATPTQKAPGLSGKSPREAVLMPQDVASFSVESIFPHHKSSQDSGSPCVGNSDLWDSKAQVAAPYSLTLSSYKIKGMVPTFPTLLFKIKSSL